MNHILQMADLVTGKKTALRLDLSDASSTLADILDTYLKHCDVKSLLEEGRITESYTHSLQDLQDLVYVSADDGKLHGMFNGIAFRQGDSIIELDAIPSPIPAFVGDTEVSLLDIQIDRINVGYDRNWVGFHKRRWDRNEKKYSEFICETLTAQYSKDAASEILRLQTSESKLKLLRALSERIWRSDFENYSRFIGDKLQYMTGDETLTNIMNGGGGICSEKIQALKLVTDHLGIECQYVLAGADAFEAVPEDKLREMLATFDFRFARRYMRYWQHVALLYIIEGQEVLVDVTNGNIPFLFLTGEDAKRVLNEEEPSPVSVKMSLVEEEFYYHRVAQDIPENLYFAMEGWIEDVDLVQVFDNELGLYISSDFFVTTVVYRNIAAFQKLKEQYLQACEKAAVECEVNGDWSMDTPAGLEFQRRWPAAAKKIIDAEEHLLKRYEECHGSGHKAGLVLIKLES